MRFYVPESDDSVDARYDFDHDEHSSVNTKERDLAFIWDIFGRAETPVDGILISRDQVEDSPSKFERFTTHGVHSEESRLNIPDWLPSISDCGAWGYKSLPFPPYDNDEMLRFYEDLGVTIGVTIDHAVLGSGKDSRLYIDKRALKGSEVTEDEISGYLEDYIDDVLVEQWPDEWPDYVGEYEPSICTEGAEVRPFERGDFRGTSQQILNRLNDDPRVVYRDDDSRFRYQLTLENAEEMKVLHERNGYSFRLMAAIQGWDPVSYAKATQRVLDQGHDYIGIGGMANSKAAVVRDTVTGIGNVVKEYERSNETRVDTHVFGFAKTQAFDAIGTTGMTSFDSASMLRSAWEGGSNYHLADGRKYDAIRIRMANHRDSTEVQIEKALRGQELLHSLRAFDKRSSIANAIERWYNQAHVTINELENYLKAHRHDEIYEQRLIRDVESAFREDYEHGHELRASFSRKFRKEFVRLLRDDSCEDPIKFSKYQSLINTAHDVFDSTFPRMLKNIRKREESLGQVGTYDQIKLLVEDYVRWIGDEDHLDPYKETLKEEPWRECNCTICQNLGIEVAIFRGNNRNRRRGFHNTSQFYNQFEESLPKLLVAVPADASLSRYPSVEDHLKEKNTKFWSQVHDLPIAEVGELTANGIHEWWQDTPQAVSFDKGRMEKSLSERCSRYQSLYLFDPDSMIDTKVENCIEDTGCSVIRFSQPEKLRESILNQIGYGETFVPEFRVQKELLEFTP